jgi:hypothetical protein
MMDFVAVARKKSFDLILAPIIQISKIKSKSDGDGERSQFGLNWDKGFVLGL